MPVKFDPKNKNTLLSSDRRHTLDVHRIISTIPILPYHIVADIGCGPGYFAIPFGKYLFDGKVYALDIQKEMLDATSKALKKLNLRNVDVLKSTEKKIPLENDSLDGAILAFVLQEATSPKSLLKETIRCLKKSGWLAILEWKKKEMDEGPPINQRLDEEETNTIATDLGFRFRSRHNLNDRQYMIVMRK